VGKATTSQKGRVSNLNSDVSGENTAEVGIGADSSGHLLRAQFPKNFFTMSGTSRTQTAGDLKSKTGQEGKRKSAKLQGDNHIAKSGGGRAWKREKTTPSGGKKERGELDGERREVPETWNASLNSKP